MISGITPFHCGTYDCSEDAIATLLPWIGRDYKLTFAESWGFRFDYENINSGRIGEKIGSMRGELGELLGKYCGIRAKLYNNSPDSINKGIMNVVLEELKKGVPAALIVDLFWLPWSEYYQRVNSMHICIATGYNSDGSLYCVDPTMMKADMLLPVSDFDRGCYGCYTFELDEFKESKIDWRYIIENAVKRLLNNNCFERIRKFAEVLNSSFDMEKEIADYSEITEAPLFKNLLVISQGRVNFANVVKYLAQTNKINKLVSISKDLEKCGWQWQTVRMALLRDCYEGKLNADLSVTAEKIKALADIEEDVAGSILKVCSENGVEAIEKSDTNQSRAVNQKKEETIFVKLADYLNNKAFGCDGACGSTGNFDGNYYSYFSGDLPEEAVWSKDGISFKLPDISEQLYDNMACNGQCIEVPHDRYSKIMILGSAEHGSFMEDIHIFYEDESEEKISLQFSDWWEPQPFFGETVMWKGRCCRIIDSQLEVLNNEVSIFSQSYSINESKTVKNIKLPEWLNIHIFSITLVKEVR